MPLGSEPSLFDLADRTPAVERARAHGKRLGLGGESASTQYGVGSEVFEAHMAGWHEGQAILAAGFKPIEPEGPAADSEAEFDDATAGKPSRRSQGAAPGADAPGTYNS